MICAPAGTPTLIVDWLDKTFTQIGRADGLVTRFEVAGGPVGETMRPTLFASTLEAEVARVRSRLDTRKKPLEMM